MYDDNENFRLDDPDTQDDYTSLKDQIVDIIENGSNEDEVDNSQIDVTTELDINRRNREGYEQLMKESSTKLDGYWDANDPFVKGVLIGLLIFIAIGAIIVLGTSLG